MQNIHTFKQDSTVRFRGQRKLFTYALFLVGVLASSVAVFGVVPDIAGIPVICERCLPGEGHNPACGSVECPEGAGCGITGYDYDNNGLYETVSVFCIYG